MSIAPQIKISCPKCRKQFSAGTPQIGQRFSCACGQTLEVPNLPVAVAAESIKQAMDVECPNCHGKLGVPADQMNRMTGCPHCNAWFLPNGKNGFDVLGVRMSDSAFVVAGSSIFCGGICGLFYSLFLTNTVSQGVHNIGLLNDKLAWTIATAAACLVGAIFLACAHISSKLR